MSPVKTAPAQLIAADAQLRGQYLREVLALLYPMDTPGEPPGTEYLVIPDARRPKLLVPMGSRRVAIAAVRRFTEPQSRLARLKRDAVVLALRSGAWPALLRDRVRPPGGDNIERYLREAMGTELALSVHIGPARANRKPVLQLLSPAGDTLGFAKLGTGPLTRRLVRAETAALTALSHVRLDHLRVPLVVHSGQWHGHQVLVQSPLPVWLPREPVSPARLVEAMREVAAACGTTQGWLATSPYWTDLRNRLAQVADQSEGQELGEAARKLVDACSDLGLRYGAWHGDWAPWNMANTTEGLLVWDWERFTPGVPLGFDALHHDLQRRLQSGVEPRHAVEQTVRNAGGLLNQFDVVPDSAEITALLYLVDLAARYLADRQAEAGARLGVLGTWLLPVLVSRVGRL
ncbi:phosphotransferase [Allorhizocola rhizosphaerae]|uniref:phosphotransferase n=1 Tax=Allorhizocola rhizosphaerae TaxID=1872709 RepID=UPI001FE40563|nr:phosphotransferase [Allorhizocola rhizosphaerae]